MEKTILSDVSTSEEVLLKCNNGNRFVVDTVSRGQYGFGKSVSLRAVNKDLTKTLIRSIGYTKPEIDWKEDTTRRNLVTEGCLITEITTFEHCLEKAIEYINNFG